MIKKLKVLIVEDEFFTAKFLFDVLVKHGYEPLDPVSTGEDAINIALKEIPDIILMDINLAGKIDGFDAAKSINKINNIPLIYMTGYDFCDIKERATGTNYLTCLEKPVSIDEIIKLIKEV